MAKKKNKINSGHYLELMDRIHVSVCNISDHIFQHPLAENHKEIQALIEKSMNNLIKAYQLVGAMSIEKD